MKTKMMETKIKDAIWEWGHGLKVWDLDIQVMVCGKDTSLETIFDIALTNLIDKGEVKQEILENDFGKGFYFISLKEEK